MKIWILKALDYVFAHKLLKYRTSFIFRFRRKSTWLNRWLHSAHPWTPPVCRLPRLHRNTVSTRVLDFVWCLFFSCPFQRCTRAKDKLRHRWILIGSWRRTRRSLRRFCSWRITWWGRSIFVWLKIKVYLAKGMASSESYYSLILRLRLIFQLLPSVIGGRVLIT